MTKACNWHLKYETWAGVNEAQGSYRAALVSRKVKLGRDRSSQHCSRVGQQGKGEPQKTQAGLKISNCRIRRIFFFFCYSIKQHKGSKVWRQERCGWAEIPKPGSSTHSGQELLRTIKIQGEAVLEAKGCTVRFPGCTGATGHRKALLMEMAIIQFIHPGSCQLRGDGGK